MCTPQPHDLLRLMRTHQLPSDAPPWARAALNVTPFVVVRRAIASTGGIAAGVRGTKRSERCATELDPAAVCEVVTPEGLAHADPRPGRELAVMSTLRAVRPLLDDAGLPWGPTGSVGFELATGVPTATPASDLDLLIRIAPGAVAALPALVKLHRTFGRLTVRVDCQVETPTGASALVELISGRSEVLARTAEGPRLVPRAVAVS